MTLAKKIHFVGIGGIGMSGIAKILLRSGYQISGSDQKENKETEQLRDMGAAIFIGHRILNLQGADALVYSSAIPKENPEYQEAIRLRIPVLARAEMLSELMRLKTSIVVAGSHGKTTTSAMITTMLQETGFDPTAVIGGRLKSMASNAKLGTDDWFVCESDESDGSFLKLLPTVAVITNIDTEHLSHYGTFEKLEQAFMDFSNRVPFDGLVVVCKDNPQCIKIIESSRRRVVTYGFDSSSDISARKLKITLRGTQFEWVAEGKKLGTINLPVIGEHNVLNALAAATVGLHLGLTPEQIAKGLHAFSGIERRLEWKGNSKGIDVIDDYAHHPTEIKASLAALRNQNLNRKIRVIFQPHRFSRVRDLWDLFVNAFDQADELILIPIYAASESAISGITSERLTESINKRGKINAHYASSIEEGCTQAVKKTKSGDLIVTMGAGDITRASSLLLATFEKQTVKEANA